MYQDITRIGFVEFELIEILTNHPCLTKRSEQECPTWKGPESNARLLLFKVDDSEAVAVARYDVRLVIMNTLVLLFIAQQAMSQRC